LCITPIHSGKPEPLLEKNLIHVNSPEMLFVRE